MLGLVGDGGLMLLRGRRGVDDPLWWRSCLGNWSSAPDLVLDLLDLGEDVLEVGLDVLLLLQLLRLLYGVGCLAPVIIGRRSEWLLR